MIQINLLPTTDRKGGAAKKAEKVKSVGGAFESLVVLVFAGATFAVVGATGYLSWNKVHQTKVAYHKLESEKKQIESEIDKFSDKAKEVQRMREIFDNQWEVLQSLDPPNRILWSEKINMLADLIPADVFLTKLHLEEHVTDVEIESSIEAREKWEAGGKKGPKPPVVKKPVITYTFRITGLATGSDNVEQFDNVIKFSDAIVAHESTDARGNKTRFMDNFSPNIDFEELEATLYEGTPVNQFTFRLTTEPMGKDEKPASKPTQVAESNQAAKPAKKS